MSKHINNQARRQAVLKKLIHELHEGKSVEGEFGALLQGEKRLLDEGV